MAPSSWRWKNRRTFPLLQPAEGPDRDGDGRSDGCLDVAFDCFWSNTMPLWGSLKSLDRDDPTLDRDDTDGEGPENLNLDSPEDGSQYRVGVHYWANHGFGASFATLRVYIYGELASKKTGVKMVERDLWEVCTVDWPSGVVTPMGNGTRILPNYENDDFQ